MVDKEGSLWREVRAFFAVGLLISKAFPELNYWLRTVVCVDVGKSFPFPWEQSEA